MSDRDDDKNLLVKGTLREWALLHQITHCAVEDLFYDLQVYFYFVLFYYLFLLITINFKTSFFFISKTFKCFLYAVLIIFIWLSHPLLLIDKGHI